jgi:hypothetical protein
MALSENNEPYMTAEDFCRDREAVNDLKQFTASETGRKLIRVLGGLHPLNQASKAGNLNMAGGFAITQAEMANPTGTLGFMRGYQAVVNLLTQTLVLPLPAKTPPASRKGGAVIPTHPSPLP